MLQTGNSDFSRVFANVGAKDAKIAETAYLTQQADASQTHPHVISLSNFVIFFPHLLQNLPDSEIERFKFFQFNPGQY